MVETTLLKEIEPEYIREVKAKIPMGRLGTIKALMSLSGCVVKNIILRQEECSMFQVVVQHIKLEKENPWAKQYLELLVRKSLSMEN